MTDRRAVLGIDVGGGGVRVLAVDIDGDGWWLAARRWTSSEAAGTAGWGFDLDCERVWTLVGEAAREAIERADLDPEDVIGVAASSMRHATVLVDGAGHVTFAAPNRDARASSEATTLAAEHGERLAAIAGHWPAPMFPAARLRWLLAHGPEVVRGAASMLSVSDWLGLKLCGEARAERSQASETLLLDVAAAAWSTELVEVLRVPGGLLPPLADSGERLGGLTAEAAAHLGLSEGTAVAAGAGDTQSALLAAGAVNVGDACAVLGTTAPLQRVVGGAVFDAERAWTACHAVAGMHVVEVNGGPTGEAVDAFAALLFAGSPVPAAALCAEAADVDGPAATLSTVAAEPFRPAGLRLPVAHLALSPLGMQAGRAGVCRGVVDGLAFGLAAHAEQLAEVTGEALQRLRVTGGMSQSPVLTAALAEALGIPVDVGPGSDATALGAAMCAATGAGAFDGLEDASRALSRLERTHEPSDPRWRERFEAWRGWRDELADASDAASMPLLEAILQSRSADLDAHGEGDAFRPRVLVTSEMDEGSLADLREIADVEYACYREVGRLLAGEDLVEALAGFQVLVTEVDVVDAASVEQLPDLRAVVVCRSNPVNVDAAACAAFGVPVMRTPGRNAVAVAELAVAFVLAAARKIVAADAFLREPGGEAGDMGRMGMAHERFVGREVGAMTVGLVGLGAVGRLTAARLAGFGGRLLAYDPFCDAGRAAAVGAELVDLDTLLTRCDVVSLHAPVTDATRGMIGGMELSRMKPGAFLVNTARAALVDEEALTASLRIGHLGGAALDVFSVEPPAPDHPLLQVDDVLATPHIAGNTAEVPAHQGRVAVAAVRALLDGEAPEHIVDASALQSFAWTGDRRSPDAARLDALKRAPGPAVTDIEQEEEEARVEAAEPADGAGKPGFFGRLFGKKKPDAPAAEPVAVAAPSAVASSEAARWMTDVARTFTDRLLQDESVAAFSKGKSISVQYVASDVDVPFFMYFEKGEVAAGLGAPPRKPDVTIKMKAATLDGVFAGTVSGMKAAMSGRLSFTGNTVKAMSMQRLQGNVTRLYKEARDAVGEPPDLEAVAEAPVAAAAAAPAPGAPMAAPAAYPATVAGDLCAVVDELVAAGMLTSTGGNVSARDPDRPDTMLVTPSNLFKGGLRPDMMVRTNLEGDPVGDSSFAPTSERQIHGSILAARPDVGAVVHSHAPQATILAMAGLEFLPISTEAAFVGDIPVVPFLMPGTPELAERVAEAIGSGPAVLMQNHGLVVAGSSLRRAADITFVIEHTAEALVTCHMLGKAPPLLPEETVAMLREIGEMIA